MSQRSIVSSQPLAKEAAAILACPSVWTLVPALAAAAEETTFSPASALAKLTLILLVRLLGPDEASPGMALTIMQAPKPMAEFSRLEGRNTSCSAGLVSSVLCHGFHL